MVNIGGVEDDDDAHSDLEIYNVCDDWGPQSRIINEEEGLQRSLASYLRSQRGVLPWSL